MVSFLFPNQSCIYLFIFYAVYSWGRELKEILRNSFIFLSVKLIFANIYIVTLLLKVIVYLYHVIRSYGVNFFFRSLTIFPRNS